MIQFVNKMNEVDMLLQKKQNTSQVNNIPAESSVEEHKSVLYTIGNVAVAILEPLLIIRDGWKYWEEMMESYGYSDCELIPSFFGEWC